MKQSSSFQYDWDMLKTVSGTQTGFSIKNLKLLLLTLMSVVRWNVPLLNIAAACRQSGINITRVLEACGCAYIRHNFTILPHPKKKHSQPNLENWDMCRFWASATCHEVLKITSHPCRWVGAKAAGNVCTVKDFWITVMMHELGDNDSWNRFRRKIFPVLLWPKHTRVWSKL